MGFFDKLREKTVADVVDTAKEKVHEAAKSVTEDKVRSALTLLPLIATAAIVFGEGKSGRNDIPSHQVINNYYYYGERRKADVPDCR